MAVAAPIAPPPFNQNGQVNIITNLEIGVEG